MIRELSIKNYKSVFDLKLELGKLNVFIGENGCGKTNLLEAVAMAGAAVSDRLDTEELYLRGIRVAKPSITRSSFAGTKQVAEIEMECAIDSGLQQSVERGKVRLRAEEDRSNGGWVDADWKPVRQFVDTEITTAVGSLARAEEQLFNLEQGVREIDSKARLLSPKKRGKVERQLRSIRDAWKSPPAPRLASTMVYRAALRAHLDEFLIFNANQLALRGLMNISRKEPLGIYGENLDVCIASLGENKLEELLRRASSIRWVERVFTDPEDKLKLQGYKLGRSTSTLYFRDRFMRRRSNVFSAENANEGILHVLFYLTLFISDRTPRVFGIDNIETALNPRLCRTLIKQLAELAKAHDKQALITTHNPAILDGLDLHDDDQRLFVVSRNDAGQTVAERVKLKPPSKKKEPRLMLSEMWMRGLLGGLPQDF